MRVHRALNLFQVIINGSFEDVIKAYVTPKKMMIKKEEEKSVQKK
ncbi:MAG TPA: hypothetical protein VIU35_18230 [Chitinophagaceae bacterium]